MAKASDNPFPSVLLVEQASAPATPAAGQARLYRGTDNKLHIVDDTGVATDATVSRVAFTFSKAGTLAVAAGTHRLYNDTGGNITITGVRASVGTTPTGADLLVDVNKNGTTIFTTQTNRPTVAATTNTDKANAIDVATWADGEYLTVDIDQVGSTVAGSDLTVTVTGTR